MAAPDPQAIIMAGFDSNFGGVNFAQIALNRQARLIAVNPRLKVTLMDVAAGTTTVSQITPDGKSKAARTVTATATHKPVTSANYSQRGHFDTDAAGRMSITDLYAAVEAIGSAKSTIKSLMEVSVFSHGDAPGPVLVDSWDQSTTDKRDPSDKDARVGKDFNSANMSIGQAAAFKAAFTDDGIWWNWGCNFIEQYRRVTEQFIGSSLYRSTPPDDLKGTKRDTDKITFSFPQAMADEFYSKDTIFFPQATKLDRKGTMMMKILKFERTVGEIKAFFLRGVSNSYSTAVAKAGGVQTRGAFPGTYADYEVYGQDDQAPAHGNTTRPAYLRSEQRPQEIPDDVDQSPRVQNRSRRARLRHLSSVTCLACGIERDQAGRKAAPARRAEQPSDSGSS